MDSLLSDPWFYYSLAIAAFVAAICLLIVTLFIGIVALRPNKGANWAFGATTVLALAFTLFSLTWAFWEKGELESKAFAISYSYSDLAALANDKYVVPLGAISFEQSLPGNGIAVSKMDLVNLLRQAVDGDLIDVQLSGIVLERRYSTEITIRNRSSGPGRVSLISDSYSGYVEAHRTRGQAGRCADPAILDKGRLSITCANLRGEIAFRASVEKIDKRSESALRSAVGPDLEQLLELVEGSATRSGLYDVDLTDPIAREIGMFDYDLADGLTELRQVSGLTVLVRRTSDKDDALLVIQIDWDIVRPAPSMNAQNEIKCFEVTSDGRDRDESVLTVPTSCE